MFFEKRMFVFTDCYNATSAKSSLETGDFILFTWVLMIKCHVSGLDHESLDNYTSFIVFWFNTNYQFQLRQMSGGPRYIWWPFWH